ncbi:MAG: hypothetical protein LBL52_01805 [Rickettsiales bacterium]|jgi:uncharacterized protein|nr:hypothetical protein [Rickettsiales bacterium]
MLEKIKTSVLKIVRDDKTGHGAEHILNTVALTERFCLFTPKANREIAVAGAWLHDVDDYKLVGAGVAGGLANARVVMDAAQVPGEAQKEILFLIKTIGYSKRLSGVVPSSIEAKIVSDADMCDAIGAHGIARNIISHTKWGGGTFRRDLFPELDLSIEDYKHLDRPANTAINHFFEKLLRLSSFMLTEPGKAEAEKRKAIMVEFLRQYFLEIDAAEWLEYLEGYLNGEF